MVTPLAQQDRPVDLHKVEKHYLSSARDGIDAVGSALLQSDCKFSSHTQGSTTSCV